MHVMFGLDEPIQSVADTFFGEHFLRARPMVRNGAEANKQVGPGAHAPIAWGFGDHVVFEQVRWSLENDRTESTKFVIPDRRTSHAHRCLIPVSHVDMACGDEHDGGESVRLRLRQDPWFCLGGVYRPHGLFNAHGFALLACEAGEDLKPYCDLQPIIVPRQYWIAWLNSSKDTRPIQRPLPAGQLEIETRSAPLAC